MTAECPWLSEIDPTSSPAAGGGVLPEGLLPPPPQALTVAAAPARARRAISSANSRRGSDSSPWGRGAADVFLRFMVPSGSVFVGIASLNE
jgi:hypothetical protein